GILEQRIRNEMRANALRLLALGASLAAVMLQAHHEFAAEFDDKKPVTLRGTISKVEWTDPHVFVYVDVKDANGLATWAVEFASRSELRKAGWTRESFKVGDQVTVEGSAARDGSNTAGGKSVQLAGGKKLMEPPANAQTPHTTGAAKPTPRWPDGHPRLG